MCPIGTLNSVHVSNSEFYQLHTVKLVYSKFTTEILWLTLLLLQKNIDIKVLLWVFHLLIYVLNFFLVERRNCQTMYEVFQIVVAPKICYGWVLLLFVFLLWVYCRILWIPTLDLFNYLSVIRGLSCNTSFFFTQCPGPPLPVGRPADPALWPNPLGDDLLRPLQVGYQGTEGSHHAVWHEVQIKGDKSCNTPCWH